MRISKTACRKKTRRPSPIRRRSFSYTLGIIIRFAIMKSSADTAVCHGFCPQQRVSGSAVPAACRRRRDWLPMGRPGIAAVWRRRCRCSPPRRSKRGQGHHMVPLPPLDSPKPSFAPRHPFGRAAKRGKRGLGSVRRADFGTLSGPEFTLRNPPRITVRGQTVQGGSSPLRKAPLRSRVYPWSTKRPCGPLAFRRATEGSRVQRKVRGVKRGQETMFGVLSPFVLRR